MVTCQGCSCSLQAVEQDRQKTQVRPSEVKGQSLTEWQRMKKFFSYHLTRIYIAIILAVVSLNFIFYILRKIQVYFMWYLQHLQYDKCTKKQLLIFILGQRLKMSGSQACLSIQWSFSVSKMLQYGASFVVQWLIKTSTSNAGGTDSILVRS